MGWELLMQLPAGSGLPSGTASSPKSIIRRWTGLNSGTFNISSPTARAFSTRRSAISNPNWSVCRTTAWDTAVRIRIQPGAMPLSKRSSLIRTWPAFFSTPGLTGDELFISGLRLYALCAPHLEVGGWGNSGYVARVAGRTILIAERKGTWLALAATVPFSRVSCGYVGRSDGWTDLAGNFQMDWEFDHAPDGNIALTGELDLTGTREFTLGLAFGNSQHHAVSTLFQALSTPFAEHCKRFAEQWERSSAGILPLEKASGDGGNLYRASFNLLRAHEDKSYPGAFIASLSIPWGEAVGDEDQGGYHLVWTRDMVNSANAMLAAGDRTTPLRALIYLNVSQQENGGFAQNFWIDGEPYWRGVQLDEVAFPILLAWRLQRENALQDFDPYPMVLRAAAYLVRHGPLTPQERWEEVSGYSPSTLASNIAALICAACFARERGDDATAKYLEEYADFLECHVESWTVTTEGTLLPGVARHYLRILPERADNPTPEKIRTKETSPLRTARPARRASFQPKKSWMRVFWNSCGTESAGPTIRSLWIPSRWWTPC